MSTTLRVLVDDGSLHGANLAPYNEKKSKLPQRFSSISAMKTALNAPADANYVQWTFGNLDLETVFASLSANDILVLPERVDPYLINSANGFMAANVVEIDGPSGTRTPIVANPRLWFSMSRARRGIVGMGPGVVIKPSTSSWSAPAQPYPQTVYYQGGGTGTITGSQNTLIEIDHSNAFVANFTMEGADFGGCSYTAIRNANTSTTFTAKNLLMDECWRGFSGIPNGETAALGILGGSYLLENITINSNGGPSPIMWNRTTGGVLRNVKAAKPNYGMLTMWRCTGTNNFFDVDMDGHTQAINLEEGGPNFVLNWTGGTVATDGSYHVIGEASPGSKKITFTDVTLIGGFQPGALNCHFYSYNATPTQKRTDISNNRGAVYAVGSVI